MCRCKFVTIILFLTRKFFTEEFTIKKKKKKHPTGRSTAVPPFCTPHHGAPKLTKCYKLAMYYSSLNIKRCTNTSSPYHTEHCLLFCVQQPSLLLLVHLYRVRHTELSFVGGSYRSRLCHRGDPSL